MSYEFLIPLAGAILALLCLYFSLRAARRQRLVDNLPTSKTTGVFIGLVELKGTAEVERPLVSYLAEAPCVYYHWLIQEHWSRTVTETYTDSKGRTKTRTRRESGWTTVDSGRDQIDFYLRDDEGVIRVKPEGASIDPLPVFDETCGRSDPLYYDKGPAHAVAHSDHRRRFTEQAIPLHQQVYLMGPARERDDVVAPEIRHDRDAAMYLISTETEQSVRRDYALQFWFLGILAIILAVAGWLIFDLARELEPSTRIGTYVLAGSVGLAAWLLGWVWMAFNSLIDLRQRVRQAWANVDVQLKRRSDLIPNLVRAVEGLRDHERTVQEQLAELRAQLTATAPGETGPDPRGCAPVLLAIVEAYPELKSDESFNRLQASLIDTEQRVALARTYFNDIATFYNTRLQVIPDRYLAALGNLRPQPLITATDFERAPVHVSLAD